MAAQVPQAQVQEAPPAVGMLARVPEECPLLRKELPLLWGLALQGAMVQAVVQAEE